MIGFFKHRLLTGAAADRHGVNTTGLVGLVVLDCQVSRWAFLGDTPRARKVWSDESAAGTGGDSMQFDWTALRRASLALALFACGVMGSAWADNPPSRPEATTLADQKGSPGARAGQTPSTPSAAEQHRLPPDSTTRQTLELPGRTLAFTATAGSIRLFDDKGEPQADIAYASYQLDGGDRATRPVTFFFNGDLVHRRPGYSSAMPVLGGCRSMPTRLHHRSLRR